MSEDLIRRLETLDAFSMTEGHGVNCALDLIEKAIDLIKAQAAQLTLLRQEGAWKPETYNKFSVKTGDDVWVRAVVTDNCTTCCGVSIRTIHKANIGAYVKAADLGLALPPTNGET